MIYEKDWSIDAVRMLYLHLNLKYDLYYVSSINVLGAANQVNLTVSCSSQAEEEGKYHEELYKFPMV